MERIIHLLEGIDWGTYSTFRFHANRLAQLKPFMLAADWLGSYAGVALVLMLSVLFASQVSRWRTALVIIVAVALGGTLVEVIRQTAERPRPPDAQNVLAPSESAVKSAPVDLSPSFPSRGVFLGTFAWLMLAHSLERRVNRFSVVAALYAVAILFIVGLCVSQIWLGLHFVTDVVAGLVGGIALALTVRLVGLLPSGGSSQTSEFSKTSEVS